MKHKISLLSILFIFFIIMFSNKIFGINSDAGYIIENYKMDIIVNEDNTFDVTETIDVRFTEEGKRGIIRNIPRVNDLKRENGEYSKNIAYLTNLEVNDDFKYTKDRKYYNIKIGKNDVVASKEKTYIIKYKYDIGKDPLKDIDEFYFYIIGEGWNTTINNVEFKIKMPKMFDENKVKFFNVYKNNFRNLHLNYIIREKTIIASYNKKLQPNEGLSIRMILPKGYFYRKWIPFTNAMLIKMFISLILVIVAIIIWMSDEKNKWIVCKSEYYPPNNMNSLVLTLLYYGIKDDAVMLLVGLLNKGYLRFEEIRYDSSNWKNFKIIKIKDYDGNDKYEKIIFEELFKNKDVIEKEEYKYIINDITQKVYDGIDIESFNKKRIDKKSVRIKNLIFIMSMIVMMFMFWSSLSDIVIKAIIMLVFRWVEKRMYPFIKTKTYWIFIMSLIIVPLDFLFNGIIRLEDSYLIEFIFESICFFILTVLFIKKNKVIKENIMILERIDSFYKFLRNPRKDKLNELIKNDPNYLYKMIPYIVSLNLLERYNNKYIKDLLNALGSPAWYEGNEEFKLNLFVGELFKMHYGAYNYSDDSSYGGFFGGSSGGGSGGGGGSSW